MRRLVAAWAVLSFASLAQAQPNVRLVKLRNIGHEDFVDSDGSHHWVGPAKLKVAVKGPQAKALVDQIKLDAAKAGLSMHEHKNIFTGTHKMTFIPRNSDAALDARDLAKMR